METTSCIPAPRPHTLHPVPITCSTLTKILSTKYTLKRMCCYYLGYHFLQVTTPNTFSLEHSPAPCPVLKINQSWHLVFLGGATCTVHQSLLLQVKCPDMRTNTEPQGPEEAAAMAPAALWGCRCPGTSLKPSPFFKVRLAFKNLDSCKSPPQEADDTRQFYHPSTQNRKGLHFLGCPSVETISSHRHRPESSRRRYITVLAWLSRPHFPRQGEPPASNPDGWRGCRSEHVPRNNTWVPPGI